MMMLALMPAFSALAQYRNVNAYQELEDSETVTAFKSHVRYLSSSMLEGRKAGSEGEVLAAEYVAEKYEDFDDGVIMYTDGGLMDEINENLKSCSTYDDRVRYIISLLQPFKEFAAAFNSKEQTDERKRAIERCKNDMKSWENVAEDAVDELTG